MLSFTVSAQVGNKLPKDSLPPGLDSAIKNNLQKKETSYITIQGGQVMVVENGKVSKLTKEMPLSNGAVIMPNRTMKMKEGTILQLKEGDRIYFNGTVDPVTKPNNGTR